MKQRIALTLATASIACLALGACSGDSLEAEKSNAGEEGGALGGDITLYTSEPEAKITEIIAGFNEDHPNVNVNVFRAGTGELTARIAAEEETGGVQADILLAADAPTFERYKDDGLFTQFVPDNSDELIDSVVDPDGYYVGTRIIPTIIAVNSNADVEDPSSWQDLTQPAYEGKIAMPNPDVSGAAAYNTAAWLQQDELGEDWLRALVQNNPTVLESNGPVAQAVAEGRSPVGIVVDYVVRELAQKGSPIDVIYPEDGVPYVTQPAAIMESSDNKEAAKAFISYLVSKEGQEIAVKQSYLPVRNDVGSPEGAPAIDEINLMEPDLETIGAEQGEAVEFFNSLLDG